MSLPFHSRKRYSRSEPDAPQQIVEARVRAQGVQSRVKFQPAEPKSFLPRAKSVQRRDVNAAHAVHQTVSVAALFDGAVSVLHSYTVAELKAFTEELAGSGYEWEVGETQAQGLRASVTYLIGYPAVK